MRHARQSEQWRDRIRGQLRRRSQRERSRYQRPQQGKDQLHLGLKDKSHPGLEITSNQREFLVGELHGREYR